MMILSHKNRTIIRYLWLSAYADFKCRWASNENPNRPSNYDVITEWALEQIRNYRSILVKPLFIIV